MSHDPEHGTHAAFDRRFICVSVCVAPGRGAFTPLATRVRIVSRRSPTKILLQDFAKPQPPPFAVDTTSALFDVTCARLTLPSLPPLSVMQVVAEAGAAPSTVLQPSETNSRVACENVLRVAEQQEPVFAVEQEYAIIHPAYPTKVPLGPRRPSTSRASSCHSGSRRSSYVSSGSARGGIGKNSSHHGGKQSHAAAAAAAAAVAGIPWPSPDACEQTAQEASAARQKASRQLADSHLRCCLFAGVRVTGADVHSLDGLHSYKIGPSPGVDLGDDLWTSRYLLQRVAEQHSASVSWEPDSMPSERPLGCHFKYSTASTRQAPHGLNAIEQQLVRLQATHVQHQVAYNDGRLDRLSSPEASTFTHAVGSANASVVVPSLTFLQQGGYFTDRRPPSDADPYKVTLLLAATTLDIPLPKLPASSSAGNTAANCSGGMSAGPSSCPAAAALPFGSPMQSYLLAAAAAQRQQQQQHLMFDTESEECDSVDEDDAMTEDSAALLAKMDDDGGAAEASSCDSDFEDQDDASSSPITGTWADNDCTHMLGAGI